MNKRNPLVRTVQRSMIVLLVILADLLAIVTGFILSGMLAGIMQWHEPSPGAEARWFLITIIVLLGLQTSLGSYRSFRSVSLSKQNRIALRSCGYGLLMIFSIEFVVQREIVLEAPMALFMALLPFVVPGARSLLWTVVVRTRPSWSGALRTMVIGEGPLARKIVDSLNRIPGYQIVDMIPVTTQNGHAAALETLRLEERIAHEQPDLLLLSSSSINGSGEYLERLCRAESIPIRVIPPDLDILLSRAAIDDLMGFPLVLSPNHSSRGGMITFKRIVDLAGAAVLTVLLSPLLLLVAAATKLESRGPVLFRQRRCLSGTDRVFDIYKFRSMTHEAERSKASLRNESNGALFKVRQDPRVTRVGRIIRRYSIDELPQLINIFKGDMSLVGPRPLPVEDFMHLSEEDKMGTLYHHRSAMKPGLTGLWQISGRSDLGFREMLLLDIYYIENHTHLFDLEILLRTIPAVLFARGAY